MSKEEPNKDSPDNREPQKPEDAQERVGDSPDPNSDPRERGTGSEQFEAAGAEDKDLQRLHDVLMREKTEPTERFTPAPLMLIAGLSALVFVMGMYLVQYSGGFDPYIFNPEQRPGDAAAEAGPQEFDPMAAGKRFFSKNCTVCHQQDGQGVPGNYPPLVGSEWVQGPEELVVRILLFGMSGPITVEGQQYNNTMPSFGSSKDRDIAAVLTWVRTNEDWGNNATPISEEFVAEIRKKFEGRTQSWNATELQEEFVNK